MELKLEEILSRTEPVNLSVEPLPRDREERIRALTMKKTKQTTRAGNAGRRIRSLIAAVAAVLLLSVPVFAAYRYNWFGFADLFGEKSGVIESDVVKYNADHPENGIVPSAPAQPFTDVYAERDGRNQAAVNATAYTAETPDYRVTLEELIATPDSVFAIIRMEAKNEAAADLAEAVTGNIKEDRLILHLTEPEGGHAWGNHGGSGDTFPLACEGNVTHFMVANIGGSYAVGDRMLLTYDIWLPDGGLGDSQSLFEVPIEHVTEETVISIEPVSDAEGSILWNTVKLNPMTITLVGNGESYDGTPEMQLVRKDGTVIEIPVFDETYTHDGFVQFAGGSEQGKTIKATWRFTEPIDLAEITAITVEGVSYPIP